MDIGNLKTHIWTWLAIESDYEWMASIFFILLLTACASMLAGWLLKLAGLSFKRTRTQWDDILVESAHKPLKVLVWVFGVFYAIDSSIDLDKQQADIFQDILNLRDVATIVMIAWALNRFISAGENYYIEQRRTRGKSVDLTTIHAVTKLLRIATNISAALIILQNMGVSIGGVLAFGGIGGIAVGFAAKDMLANFFGALIIYFDKPFKVGDWIRSPDQEIEGTVEQIGWRMTTIRTFDKRPLYVPNATFTTISVENPSRMTRRRIYETVGIRYDDLGVMADIIADVKQMLVAHEAIDESQTLIVNFNAFNSSSCDFFVYTFTHTTNWIEYHDIKQDILLKVAAIIEQHSAEIAYPTHVEYKIDKSALVDDDQAA